MRKPTPLTIKGTMHPRFEEILTPEALAFVSLLDGAHAGRRAELLLAQTQRGRRITAGDNPDFRPETAAIRSDPDWRVASLRQVWKTDGARSPDHRRGRCR